MPKECKFQNACRYLATVADIVETAKLEGDEARARLRLIALCVDVLEAVGYDPDNRTVNIANEELELG